MILFIIIAGFCFSIGNSYASDIDITNKAITSVSNHNESYIITYVNGNNDSIVEIQSTFIDNELAYVDVINFENTNTYHISVHPNKIEHYEFIIKTNKFNLNVVYNDNVITVTKEGK